MRTLPASSWRWSVLNATVRSSCVFLVLADLQRRGVVREGTQSLERQDGRAVPLVRDRQRPPIDDLVAGGEAPLDVDFITRAQPDLGAPWSEVSEHGTEDGRAFAVDSVDDGSILRGERRGQRQKK